MAFVIKTLIPATETQVYKNTQDVDTKELLAVNIVLNNTSASSVDVSLSFYNPDISEIFETGAVIFETPLAAKTSITIQDRYVYQDDIISCYASTPDAVSLSIDVLNDTGRYTPPLP